MRLLELIKLAVAAPSGAEHKRRRADRFYATRMYGGGAKKASSTYADLGNMPNASPIHRNIFNAIVHRGVSTMSERPSYGHELLRSLNSITPAAALPARKNDPLSFGSFSMLLRHLPMRLSSAMQPRRGIRSCSVICAPGWQVHLLEWA